MPPEADAAWEAAQEERERRGPAPGLDQQVRTALAQRRWPQAIAGAIALGTRDENALTDLVFSAAHPERRGRPIAPHERSLAQEWKRIRDGLVRPALQAAYSPGPVGPPAAVPVVRSTTWLRRAWAEHLGGKTVPMVPLRLFGLPATPVHPYTVDAWRALERALTATGYRPRSVWNFNNRSITGGSAPSLHAYGIATDIDPPCNPYRVTPDQPLVRFSTQPTQEQRCAEVRARLADTAFIPRQVAVVEAITTVDGLQAITWGGRWRSVKDAMHFQINVSPEELRRGLRLR
ncbi:M15 family metallopeptidase [Geodermatophilus sp. DSM 45219]|uniref:M15 family metallopeptidase n=1 Tax=Geodermatophilus sp. DSM 45219 TaxID=1881103 RepID=UPI0015A39FFC|nr:M15 family metallopeptidase [Geodermatophilus sp. DSM 45219]